MSKFKPLGPCPYTSTGLWFGITEKKHNILDHLPTGMSFSSRDSSDIHSMFNSFREEHIEDVEQMKKIIKGET